MTKGCFTKELLLVTCGLVAGTLTAQATPSTVFWTPATPYIQPYGILHLTDDNYFTAEGMFPADVGLEIGVLPWDKLQAEVGFDLIYPGLYPFYLNGKIGTPEDKLFDGSPGWSAGIFGVGTKADDPDKPGYDGTGYNVGHFDLGKTLKLGESAGENLGSFSVGGYYGNSRILVNGDGDPDNAGVMAGYYRTLDPLTDKVAVCADWMSGNNIYGGGGPGIYLWPAPNVDVILGWVWFNDIKINPYKYGVFTIQVDVDFDLNPAEVASE